MKMKKFHYCAYWHTWNRNLGLHSGFFIELDLTPVNGFGGRKKAEIEMEVLRAHCTARSKGDLDTDKLPASVVEEIQQNVSPAIFERLMNHDYLSEVTVDQIIDAKSNGGGAPLRAIKEGTYWEWP